MAEKREEYLNSGKFGQSPFQIEANSKKDQLVCLILIGFFLLPFSFNSFLFSPNIHLSFLVFEVSASADLEKLSWRSSGPQHIFIQKMVYFLSFHFSLPATWTLHISIDRAFCLFRPFISSCSNWLVPNIRKGRLFLECRCP